MIFVGTFVFILGRSYIRVRFVISVLYVLSCYDGIKRCIVESTTRGRTFWRSLRRLSRFLIWRSFRV